MNNNNFNPNTLNSSLEQLIDKANNSKTSIQQYFTNNTTFLKNLREKVGGLREKIERLKAIDFSGSSRQLVELRQQLQDQTNELNSVRGQLTELDERARQLAQQNEEVQKQLQQTNASKQQIEREKQQFQQQLNDIAALQSPLMTKMNDLNLKIDENIGLLNTYTNNSIGEDLLPELEEMSNSVGEIIEAINRGQEGNTRRGGSRRKRKTKRKNNRKKKTRKYYGGWKYSDSSSGSSSYKSLVSSGKSSSTRKKSSSSSKRSKYNSK